jgi:hypothetical protein
MDGGQTMDVLEGDRCGVDGPAVACSPIGEMRSAGTQSGDEWVAISLLPAVGMDDTVSSVGSLYPEDGRFPAEVFCCPVAVLFAPVTFAESC